MAWAVWTDQVEVFHAWEAAETGVLVAVAAELGSNQLVGMLRVEGGGYRAFNLRDTRCAVVFSS
jgi:hypothetical protein